MADDVRSLTVRFLVGGSDYFSCEVAIILRVHLMTLITVVISTTT